VPLFLAQILAGTIGLLVQSGLTLVLPIAKAGERRLKLGW
jgi:hypothetical protein